MYLEFLYLPLDYISILTTRERCFEMGLPVSLGIGTIVYAFYHPGIQMIFIDKFILYIEILLGFMLTAFSVIVSAEKFRIAAANIPSGKKIRNVPISLYRMIIVEFSFIILLSAILITLYFIAQAIPLPIPYVVAKILNGMFITFGFGLLFGTIRAITNLYFIYCRT